MIDERKSENSCEHCKFYGECPLEDLFEDAYDYAKPLLKEPSFFFDAVEELLAEHCPFYTDQREAGKK